MSKTNHCNDLLAIHFRHYDCDTDIEEAPNLPGNTNASISCIIIGTGHVCVIAEKKDRPQKTHMANSFG